MLQSGTAHDDSEAIERSTEFHTKRQLTLVELLRWTYGVQCADSMSGKLIYSHGDAEVHYASGDGFTALREGDGRHYRNQPQTDWQTRIELHPDAETVHEIVLLLPPLDAMLVIKFGYNGILPEHEIPIPMPAPPAPNVETIVAVGGDNVIQRGDRIGRGRFQGETVLYRIAVAHVFNDWKPIYRGSGRKRTVLDRYELIRTEVEYCPLIWWPTLEQARAANTIAERWESIMNRIANPLAMVDFSEHSVTDFGRWTGV